MSPQKLEAPNSSAAPSGTASEQSSRLIVPAFSFGSSALQKNSQFTELKDFQAFQMKENV